jgi:hypothetical protein
MIGQFALINFFRTGKLYRALLHRVTSIDLVLDCKLPVCPCEPTCSGTASTEAMGQEADLSIEYIYRYFTSVG